MPTYSAGSASVDISPNFSGFVEDLRAKLEAVEASLPIRLDLDDAAFAARLEELARDREVRVRVIADMSGFDEELDRAGQDRRRRPPLPIPVGANLDPFQRDLLAQLQAAQRDAEVRIPLTADGERLRAGLRAQVAEISASIRAPISVDPEIGAGQRVQLEAALRAFQQNLRVQVPVGIDSAAARADLDAFQNDLLRTVQRLQRDAEVRIPLTADGERLREQLRAQIADLESRIQLDIPADAQLGAEARARLRADVEILQQQLRIQIPVDVDESRLEAVRGGAERAIPSLNAMSRIKFTALAAGISALIPVIGGVIGAAGAAVGIFGGLAATIGLGSGGLLDAFKAMGQEAKAGSQDAADAAQKQTDAINAVADAQNSLLDAQHSQQDSLQAITDAQTNLTQARQAAKDALDDLNLSEKAGELAARGASLSYAEAAANLQKTIRAQSLGKASQLDVQRAQLNVDSASQNITDTNVHNQQSTQKTQQANAQGVDNSPQVLAAQKALVGAQYNAIDAQHATTDAVNALAKAQQAAAKAASDGTGGVNAFNEAMKKLSPNAQEFVRAMQAIGPEFTTLRKSIQDNLFAGLGDTVTKFFEDQKQGITDTLGGIATAINGAIKQTFGAFDDMFTKLTADGTMKKFVDSIGQALTGLAPFLTGLTQGFINFTNQVGPALGPFLAGLGQAFNQMSGPLGQLGATFLNALTPLLPQLATFVGNLANGLAPILPTLSKLISDLFTALTPVIKPFGDLVNTIGQMFDDIIKGLQPYLVPFVDNLDQIFKKLQPLIEPLARLTGTVFVQLAQVINDLLGTDSTGSKGATNALGDFLKALDDLVSKLHIVKTVLDALINPKALPGDLGIGGGGNTNLPGGSLGHTILKGLTFGALAAGGVAEQGRLVSGPGSGTSDSILGVGANGIPTARVSDGEYVNDASTTARFLPLLQALPGLADGGLVGSSPGTAVQNASQWAQSKVGIPYVLGGLDWSMFASGVYQELIGGNPDARAFDTTKFATPTSAAAMGFVPGISGAFSVGVTPLPGADGHMAFTLGGVNGESGGAHNNVAFGPGAAGASDPQFSVQYSLPGNLFKPPDLNATAAGGGGNYSPTGTYVGPGGTSGTSVSPQAALPGRQTDDQLSIQSDKAAVDDANAERNQIYADPSSTAEAKQGADIKYQQAQNALESAQNKGGLPQEYSLPGIASKGAGILAQGLLDSFGLGSSVLSGSNPYTSGVSTALNFYLPNGQLGGGYAYQPQNPATVTTGTSPLLSGGAATPQATPGASAAIAPAPAAPAAPIAPPSSNSANPPQPHVYQPGGGAAQWKDTFVNVLYMLGVNEDWAGPGEEQLDTESGGDPKAINLWDSNAQKGTPSKGLMQVIDPTFATYRSPLFPDDIWDPSANIAAATNYAQAAYGDPTSVWGQGHGYDQGGVADGLGFLLKQTIRPERVLSPGQTETFDSALPLLESINSGQWSPNLPQGLGTQEAQTQGGHDFSTHIHEPRVASVDDLADLVERDNFRRSIGFAAAL